MSSVIEISPLTRVEGHGRIFVHLDGKRVERVQLALTESPRLFEALLLGKSYLEVPEIVCRICSLCSTVHRVVSLQAVENALGIEVTEQVKLYRELILYGGHIQSHALHLFCLVLPDHIGATGLSDLAAKAPEKLKMGLRIKAAGNLIQETVGGRLIHPVTLIPGGMGKPVTAQGLLNLKNNLISVLSDVCQAYELFRSFSPESDSPPGHSFMAVQGVSLPALFGETLVTGMNRSIPVEEYRDALGECVPDHSYAKKSLINGKPVIVGALARLNLGMNLSPKGAEAFRDSRYRIMQKNIYANNLAQAVELIHAVEHALEIVDTLIESGFSREPPPAIPPCPGSGVSAIEAPRGVLIHSYSFDDRGLCRSADIVTPTAINQAAMEQDLLALARSMEGAHEQEMTSALERLVRAYDPCISCAVHLIKLSAKD
jgi:coenzyme F420-reducing hydrogenase alpha subunit